MNSSHNKLQVGVTGGIGAGKSIVCKIFNVLGIAVYDADYRAKWITQHDNSLKEEIIKEFGQNAYTEEGNFNRNYISNKVFNDERNLEKLNNLIHPAVRKDFLNWQQNQTSPYIIKEAALLFEAGTYKDLDIIITVTAPLEERINRVMLRDPHRSREDIENIIDKQWKQETKANQSDFVIENDNKNLITTKTINIHEKIKKH